MLKLITELQALAQSGIAYSKDHYDIGRFNRIFEISAEMLASKSNYQYNEILHLFSREEGYATPKIAVRGAVFKDNKILLVRETDDNLWALPGGWADVNLSPAENILKEIEEEAGYKCRVIKLIGVHDLNKNKDRQSWPYIYDMIFLCEIVENLNKIDEAEIHEIAFFELEKLPELSKERGNEAQIGKCFEHKNNINIPTYFE